MQNHPHAELDVTQIGDAMHALLVRLFPICRSITGNGVRETLRIIGEYLPIKVFEVPSGTSAFDWVVPKEWNIRDAYLVGPDGHKVIEFQHNNLHVVGYSTPQDLPMTRAELDQHLYSLPDQPDAIPYVTSYYRENWGFCLAHNQRSQLPDGQYRAVINSSLADGSLTYGELRIPGESRQEIFLSTYVCHPSMANNELSGPVVATALAQWIARQPRRYSYRIVFIPETIGSLVYLSRHLDEMQRLTIAGFNLTCIGDDRAYSYLPSRHGNTLADRAALHILGEEHPDFVRYSFLDRGSDERQYCSPGADLPVVSVMRSKYREYPEYHTSLDTAEVVTPAGLRGGFEVVRKCIELIERNCHYRTTCIGEPQLGKRGLYPAVGTRDSHRQVSDMINVLAYADGEHDLIGLSHVTQIPLSRLYKVVDKLAAVGLLEICPNVSGDE